MKAQDLQFTRLLEGSKQFIIPIFQRTYSWEESHCRQLWDDIIRISSHAELNSHFIGSAVYIPEDDTKALDRHLDYKKGGSLSRKPRNQQDRRQPAKAGD
jgi:hypothetical protein